MRSGRPIVLALALAALGCARQEAVVPRELLGRWVSADPDYAGRSLTLLSRSVTFGLSKTESESFTVRGVEAQPETDGGLSVEIIYGSAVEQRVLRVRRFETQPPSLALGERSGRWTLALGDEPQP